MEAETPLPISGEGCTSFTQEKLSRNAKIGFVVPMGFKRWNRKPKPEGDKSADFVARIECTVCHHAYEFPVYVVNRNQYLNCVPVTVSQEGYFCTKCQSRRIVHISAPSGWPED